MVDVRATRQRTPMWRGYAAGFAAAPVLCVLFLQLAGIFHTDSAANRRAAAALANARSLVESLERYRSRHQAFPRAKDGLEALVPEQLERIPLDPWGNAFVYEISPRGLADVRSYGADGRQGGSGEAADISGRFGVQQSRGAEYFSTIGQAAFFAILVTGFFGANRWPWAAGLLSGSGAVCAILLLAAVRRVQWSVAVMFPFALAICCITGSVALFRGFRGAATLTFIAAFIAYLMLGDLIGT